MIKFNSLQAINVIRVLSEKKFFGQNMLDKISSSPKKFLFEKNYFQCYIKHKSYICFFLFRRLCFFFAE